MIIDCPIVSSSWTPAASLVDLSNVTPATAANPPANPWPARVAQAEQVLAETERAELIDAYLKRFAY